MIPSRWSAVVVWCAALGVAAWACTPEGDGQDGGTGGTRGATGGSGGVVATGGNQSTGGTGGACSSTAPEGLQVGMLIPDMQVQHCDGTWVSLHDLVCGNVLTQVYSFAAWCPGCQSFAGLGDSGSSMGNSLYDSYHA
jgi:hypothetical protein